MKTEQLNALKGAVLSVVPSCQAIYIFGSAASGELVAGSDVDLALLLPIDRARSFDLTASIKLSTALSAVVGRDVDLINLREVDTVFQGQILSTGQRIYAEDDVLVDEFELQVIRMYQDLQQQRADIIQAGMQSGRFYS
ncbi:MAG: type VII toxin-antitoxin system MntA family adenylyltransferase antitoxin [Wenzhouxiangella sp.]